MALTLATVSNANDWQHKVSSHVLNKINQNQEVELIIKLKSPTMPLKTSKNRTNKIINKVAQLKHQAAISQKPVIDYLTKNGIKYKSFWVSNDLLIKATRAQLPDILSMDVVTHAFSNDKTSISLPLTHKSVTESPSAIEWNVSMVNAPDVWNMGYTGQNIVVAGQDTGYDWNHPAIKNQ